MDKLERREQSLIAKCQLNEGRLSQYNESSAAQSQSASRASSRAGRWAPGSGGLAPLEELKVKQLRQKKERLSYAVDRLTLQAQQRERQLRMSMAAPHQFNF